MPPGIGGFDWGWLTNTIDEYMMTYGDPLLQLANVEAFWVAVIILMIYAGKWAYTGDRQIGFGLSHFIVKLLFVELALHYYNTPLPGMSSSFKLFIPNLATDIASIISTSRWDLAMGRIVYVIDHLEKPGDSLNIAKSLIAAIQYWVITFDLVLIGGILLLPIGLGFIALGLGAVVWPICIPWILVPRLDWLFWNPLSYMIKYSFYRVFAASLTFIWAGVMVLAIDHMVFPDINGNTYSLAQFTGGVLIGFLFLNALLIMTVLGLPGFVTDFFSGGASAGKMKLPFV